MRHRSLLVPALSLLALLLSGCAHDGGRSGGTEVVGAGASAASTPVDGVTTAIPDDAAPVGGEVAGAPRACSTDAGCRAGERCESLACVPAPDCAALPAVYFDYDRDALRPGTETALADVAWCLGRDGGSGALTVEAFADERGLPDYNLALSHRRGERVRQALATAGVSARIHVVAWGEAFPAAPGAGEERWALNRRAVVKRAGELLADGRGRASASP